MNQPNSEETIFAEALRLPPKDRAAYLQQAASGDPALRQRVESLLNSYEVGDFLEQAAAPELRQTVLLSVPMTEKPGHRIGRYKLLQQIGEGGCGVVYMAEQEEPVRRRVALKIIKLGMDTKNVVARFEAERQALALMDHPNIAKVLDAGATETGRPYFVMELVRGMKITDYCDEAKLAIPARLDLFVQVCRAIQHAHQKGIIHRDIKPSNILVTVNDGVAVPMVIDFGIAKATSGQQLTDKTLFTAFEQFIGTPAYMSPEQAVLTNLDIDTRSDIYALGVLLYELLTGNTPFDSKALLAIGLDEMRRTIREKEPQRPSTRLSTLAANELTMKAQRRGIDAPKLVRELHGDLDWIVMKCLEKDRARRYETANGLARDIERHSKSEPVVARPPSNVYRFQKMFRRNKLVFAAGAAVVAALFMGLATTTWMFVKERQALQRAIAAEHAERKLRQEAELRELNAHALQRGTESNWEGAEAERRTALDAQRKSLGNDHPDVAESLRQLAQFHTSKRDFDEAEKALGEALSIRKKISPAGDLAVAQLLEDFANLRARQERNTEAEELFREAIRLRRRIQGDANDDTALVINRLAVVLARQKRYTEALPLFQQALSACRKLLGDGDPRVAVLANNVVSVLLDLGQLAQAEAVVREVMPGNVKVRPELGTVLGSLIITLLAERKYEEGDSLLNDLVSAAPNNVALLIQCKSYRGRGGHFKEASDDCVRLIGLRDDNEDYHEQAALLAYLGQTEKYHEHCRKFLDHFGKSADINSRERAAQDALLLPGSDTDTGEAIKVLDGLATSSFDSGSKPWVEFTKGLADYRRGRFADASEHLEVALTLGSSTSHSLFAKVYPVQALVHFHLGESKKTRESLVKAKTFEQEGLELLRGGDLGGSWRDWLGGFVLLREAKALVEGSPDTKETTK
jgi:serine/threonine protein kinase/tetratricopeptide (TPR) repeat protein